MSAHSIGPWHWEFHPVNNQAIALLSGDGKDLLLITDDSQGHVFAVVSEADRALIKAAPDLLSALVAVRVAHKEYDLALSQWLSAQQDFGSREQGYKDAQEHHDRCFQNRLNANEQARAAIAKATP